MSAGSAAQFIPSVGARFYRHQHFGDAWAPQVGLVAKNGPWQAHASVSRAMNFPGLEVAAFSTVAIPALVVHGFLSHRINKNMAQLERQALEFVTAAGSVQSGMTPVEVAR